MTQQPPRDAAIFTKAPWRQLWLRVLDPAQPVPTMLQDEEQRLYYWLTGLWSQDAGAVVDLGCFAGGSTARLAAGHRAAGLSGQIHGYDRFTADERTKTKQLYPNGIAPFDGHDILPLARRLLSPWQDRLTLHPGDIEDQVWDGGPIEILVMDAAKSAETADAIAASFFPALIPGRSVIVQQDFFHWRLPWLPVQMAALGACFTPLASCAGTSMLYRCDRVPDPAALKAAQVADLSDAEMIARLEAAKPGLIGYQPGAKLDRMQAVVAANPGERVAWRFTKP